MSSSHESPQDGNGQTPSDGQIQPTAVDPSAWSHALLTGELPRPFRERWQPLRAGLLNIYLFDDERFPFADGRLLLRGTNATGKSRVLAFMLPFLLDGSLHPNRLEPDRDTSRQVAWNLLMGDYHDRLGYTWLELGRRDADSGPQYLTLGCGLRAVKDRGIVEHWLFMTTRRIDRDLSLVTPQQTALTRRQLIDALGDCGSCFERATDYRRAVDEKLFRLADRYDGLIDLLLCLRQPQLARKLDLEQLQSALTESLPPLPAGLMANAADAFRSLDDDRRRLQSSQDAFEKTRAFLRPYRQHVRMGLRKAAHAVRSNNSSFESAAKELREGHQDAERLANEQRANDAVTAQLNSDYQDLSSRIHVLEQSDEARAATRLDEKRRTADTAEKNAQTWDESRRNASAVLARSESRLKVREGQIDALRQSLYDQAVEASVDLGPQPLKDELLRSFSPTDRQQELLPATVREHLDRLRAEAGRWQRYALVLNEKSAQIDVQQLRWREGQRALADRGADHLEAAELAAQQAARAGASRALLWQKIQAWREAATEFGECFTEPGTVDADWLAWAENAMGVDPLAALLETAHRQAQDRLAKEDADSQLRLESLATLQEEIFHRLAELRQGHELPPPIPPTRSASARQDRPGAPLWKIVDFASTVPLDERAGWEAALEAAGLLDAWMEPDGRLRDSEREDTILVAGDRPPFAVERQLARVLVPRADVDQRPIAAEIVAEVLARIGVGIDAGDIWVDRTGRWRNGPLSGYWRKERAQFIGTAAQEDYRARLIAAANAELTAADRQRASIDAMRLEILQRRQRLDAQRESYPASEALRGELSVLQGLERAVGDADRRRRAAADFEQAEREKLAALVAERAQVAVDFDLADWVDRGGFLQSRLEQFLRSDLRLFESTLAQLVAAHAQVHDERQERQQAFERHAAAKRDAEASQLDARRERSELQALLESHSAAAAEITARLAAARGRLTELRSQQQLCSDRGKELIRDTATREGELKQLRHALERHDAARRAAVAALEQRAARGLLRLADLALDAPEAPWSLTQGIETARAIERASGDAPIDDEAWLRSQNRLLGLHEELRANLSAHNIAPEPEFLGDGLLLLLVPFRGSIVRVDQLAAQLEAEVQEHERVLSEKERRVLEDFLLGEVGSELHRRMQQARELVERMNREVSRRPMSTGMQMRFRWELSADASEELKAARDVLMRMQETWSADEREALIRFLQRQIQNERARDDDASRQEQLRAALDYRRWHELRIERRAAADQSWRALTRRTYGSGSGGEKAVALTIPQLAAAAAYYSSADRHAPRFILLDEAFAGISVDNRGSCLELLVSFDLDVVMTSENERGCYPSVPALAICRLARVAEFPVVVNDVFIWNGKKQAGPVSFSPGAATGREASVASAGPADPRSTSMQNGQSF